MLSLLNLIIASGTVLRSDTEPWTPLSYPDPRTNYTQCNVPPESTLCDPDHILTDQWRATIHENIRRQADRLALSPIFYTEGAPDECHGNETEGLEIFVILAKRIQTATNQTINGTDMTNFGDGLADEFGLSNLTCKNFLLLVGVEQAKLAYVRTGRHLRLPTDLMESVFSQYTNLFNEKNYMEGLNKVVDEIGDRMIAYFNPTTTTEAPVVEAETDLTSTEDSATEEDSPRAEVRKIGDKIEIRIPIWVFVVLTVVILALLIGCSTVAFVLHQSGLSRFGKYVQRFFNGSEGHRGFSSDESSLPPPHSKTPHSILRESEMRSRTETIDRKDCPSTDRSTCGGDNDSCEISIPDSDDEHVEDLFHHERPVPRVCLSSSELSTDQIIVSPPASLAPSTNGEEVDSDYMRPTSIAATIV